MRLWNMELLMLVTHLWLILVLVSRHRAQLNHGGGGSGAFEMWQSRGRRAVIIHIIISSLCVVARAAEEVIARSVKVVGEEDPTLAWHYGN